MSSCFPGGVGRYSTRANLALYQRPLPQGGVVIIYTFVLHLDVIWAVVVVCVFCFVE